MTKMAKAGRISLRIPKELREELSGVARGERRPLSAVVRDLLEEALKMRRCPGIIFVDGPAGRRPVIAGTGLEVWEIVRTYRSCNGDFEKLREAYPWLSPQQLRDALNYWRAYPEEIEEEIRQQEEATARARELYPHLFPTR